MGFRLSAYGAGVTFRGCDCRRDAPNRVEELPVLFLAGVIFDLRVGGGVEGGFGFSRGFGFGKRESFFSSQFLLNWEGRTVKVDDELFEEFRDDGGW